MLSIADAFAEALKLHQQGALPKAEALYRRILDAVPDHAESTHCLGLVRSQGGQVEEALALLRRSVELDPAHPSFHANLGAVLVRAGRYDEAVACCRQAVALKPDLADAHVSLGVALEALGQIEEAVSAYRRAIALRPAHVAAYGNLGAALHKLGRLEEAIAAYRAAIERWPDDAVTHGRLGSALEEAGRLAMAEAAYRRALELQPDLPEAHVNLGVLLREQGRLDEAAEAYRRAISLKPELAEAHCNLGRALRDLGETDDALRTCRTAVALKPDLPEAHCNLGLALRDLGRLDEAVAAYRRAIALRPDYTEAHDNLALALLLVGDFDEGMREYEWRLRLRPMPPLAAGLPDWSGQPVRDRTILVWAEQGIGDQIMFSALIGDLQGQGARCIVQADPRLGALLVRSFPAIEFIPAGKAPALPAIDYQVAIGSLPRRLRSGVEAFPDHRGYLRADPAVAERLRARYRQRYPGRLLVGLSWYGGTGHIIRVRSIPLERWEPILRVPAVAFVSLQYGDCAAEIAALERKLGLEVLRDPEIDPLTSIEALAAQAAAMDLVVSTDNSTVHMAGALGVPVWVLLSKVPDWRWLAHGETSRWYPSARLFRQSERGEWSDVLARVAAELARASSSR